LLGVPQVRPPAPYASLLHMICRLAQDVSLGVLQVHPGARVSALHLRTSIRLASCWMLVVSAHLTVHKFTSQVHVPTPSTSTHTTHEQSSWTASASSRSRYVYSTKLRCAVVRLRRQGGKWRRTKRPEVAHGPGEHIVPPPGFTSLSCLVKGGNFDVTSVRLCNF
jgi:hypothetical protein